MQLNAQYDVDVVALEAEDDLTCLLTLTAPVPDGLQERVGETLIAILDDSGSMGGHRLGAAKLALHQLVDRLKPQDAFGVVTFCSDARIAVPTRQVADHHLPSVHALIDRIHARSSTDLSAGYLLGLEQARRHASPAGASVLLVSDGHANAGMTDPDALGGLASQARAQGTTTVTIGIGEGYDEILLHELAAKGQGSHRFAYSPDDAVAVVAEEAGDLLAKSIVNSFLRIRPGEGEHVNRIALLHEVPAWVEQSATGPALTVPLGDLYAGQSRELLVRFSVPGLANLGMHTLGEFVLDYVTLPDLTARTVTWPITVNVVSRQDASRRIPNPTVTTAALLAEVTKAKAEAVQALGEGDVERAATIIGDSQTRVRSSKQAILSRHPECKDVADRLDEEAEQLGKLAQSAREFGVDRSRKSLIEDISMNARGRDDIERRSRARKRRDF